MRREDSFIKSGLQELRWRGNGLALLVLGSSFPNRWIKSDTTDLLMFISAVLLFISISLGLDPSSYFLCTQQPGAEQPQTKLRQGWKDTLDRP